MHSRTAFPLLAAPLLLTAPWVYAQDPPASDEGDRQGSEARPSAEITAPKLVRFVPATVPEEAEGQPLDIKVLLELVVDADGQVADASVVRGAGKGWDEAALEAARQFEFEPAQRADNPIVVTIRYLYEFQQPAPEIGQDTAPEPTDAPPQPTEPQAHAQRQPDDYTAPGATPPSPQAAESAPTTGGNQRGDLSEPGAQDDDILFEAEATVESPPREVTRHSVPAKELTSVAGTRGDAMRAIEMLPGVARPPSDEEAAPILRGSSPWESTVMLDGTPIPLLYHFGSVVSTFNSRLLERVDLYPGNFSVRYGRVYGGIIEARARDPKQDRFHGMLELSLMDSSVLLETPIGSTSGVALAARRSNIDIYFDQMVDEDLYDVVAAPLYWDYQGILTGEVTPDHRWRLMAYGSRDSVELFFEDPIQGDPLLRGNLRGALEFHQVQGRLQSRLGLGVEQDLSVALSTALLQQVIGPAVDAKLRSYGIDSRGEWRVPAGASLTVATGFDARISYGRGRYRGQQAPQVEGNPEIYQPYTVTEQIDIATESFWMFSPAVYTELNWRPASTVTVVPGLRADYFSQLKEWSVDPRLSARYRVAENTTLKAGVGLFSQEPIYYEAMEEVGNPDLDLARAVHTSVGAEQKIGSEVEIGADAFYKRLLHRIVGTEGGAPPRFTNDGSGRVYGLELSSKVRPREGTFGYLAYTLSRSERQDRNEPWRLFDHDQTHNLILAATHELGRGWLVGARFRLVSGNPSTPVIGSVYNARAGVYEAVWGEINSDRQPLFHQLDLLGQKTWSFEDWSLSVYLDLQNAYNAEVREGTEYSYDYSESRAVSGMPIFPNFGIRGEL